MDDIRLRLVESEDEQPYRCHVCSEGFSWGPDCSWFGSFLDEENLDWERIAFFCSAECFRRFDKTAWTKKLGRTRKNPSNRLSSDSDLKEAVERGCGYGSAIQAQQPSLASAGRLS